MRRSIAAAVLVAANLNFFGCQQTASEVAQVAASTPPNELHLDARLVNEGQIKVEPVTEAREELTVRTSGKAAFNEERLSYVSSPLIGRVVEIKARPGERVEAAQTLAVIDSPDLGSAWSEFIKARADQLLAERSYALAQELAAAKAMARKDFQKAEDESVKARADLRRARERLESFGAASKDLDEPLDSLHVRSRFILTAPIAGTVIERNMTLGQQVGADASQRLFVVADLTTLWVTADVYEKDLSLVRPGEDVTVDAAAWPGERFTGRINYVGDTVDPNTRTVKVRLEVENQQLRLKPEMFVTATVHADGTRSVLSIPLAAVHGEGVGQPFVFVALDDTRFASRVVELGAKADDRVIVSKGLTLQDRVVTDGSILLKAEAERQARS
ncbi:MAG: efflux RND transporter periplasmic adaptor subunit [Deltaproteobacteria bacterium]|nr:efflux RND transporter periplasmic adaptor subunit [Deltaproteobacteria bacterium]